MGSCYKLLHVIFLCITPLPLVVRIVTKMTGLCKVVFISLVMLVTVQAEISHGHDTECDTEMERNINTAYAEREDCEKYSMSEAEFEDCSWEFNLSQVQIKKKFHKCEEDHNIIPKTSTNTTRPLISAS